MMILVVCVCLCLNAHFMMRDVYISNRVIYQLPTGTLKWSFLIVLLSGHSGTLAASIAS